jgi:hypothetical protein
VRLVQDGQPLSTHDLFGGAFVLLTDAVGGDWVDAASKAADRLGVKVAVHQIGSELEDPDNVWHTRYGLEAGGAALVRPDAVIAWRSKTAVANPAHEVDEALAAILAR